MCLDDAEILELIEGRLTPETRALASTHLDECDECRALVADATRTFLDLARHGRDAEPIDEPDLQAETMLARGEIVGRYRIEGRLGAGGMGIVYLAHDPELDRKVAVKILRADLGGTSQAARQAVLREAQAMARLSSPNVAAIYDIGIVRRARLHRDGVRRGDHAQPLAAREPAGLAGGAGGVHGGGARARRGAPHRPRPPRLQAGQRPRGRRGTRVRHRFRAGTPVCGGTRASAPARSTRSASGPWSARRATWRPSRRAAAWSTRAPTSSASASRSTKLCIARARSPARPSPTGCAPPRPDHRGRRGRACPAGSRGPCGAGWRRGRTRAFRPWTPSSQRWPGRGGGVLCLQPRSPWWPWASSASRSQSRPAVPPSVPPRTCGATTAGEIFVDAAKPAEGRHRRRGLPVSNHQPGAHGGHRRWRRPST